MVRHLRVLVKPFERAIVVLHDSLKAVGIDEAYGPSIIIFTIALKLLTFPLNKQQVESTTKMQAIAPAAKKLQDKYRNADPARLNLELQKLYQENQVNPLAGCLPSLAQIPIFIGLYRSVLNLAKEDKLTESFLWLPSLEGPVADYTQGIGWLTGNDDLGLAWSGTNPPLGWHDTLCYLVRMWLLTPPLAVTRPPPSALPFGCAIQRASCGGCMPDKGAPSRSRAQVLPVLLVISQYISTAILTPKTDDPAQQQSQAILKFLPLMIGWFSLNVPSGLGLYWMTNNVLTTLTTVLIRFVARPCSLCLSHEQHVLTHAHEHVHLQPHISRRFRAHLTGFALRRVFDRRKSVQPAMATAGATDMPVVVDDEPKPQGFGRRYGEVIESTATDGTTVRSP